MKSGNEIVYDLIQLMRENNASIVLKVDEKDYQHTKKLLGDWNVPFIDYPGMRSLAKANHCLIFPPKFVDMSHNRYGQGTSITMVKTENAVQKASVVLVLKETPFRTKLEFYSMASLDIVYDRCGGMAPVVDFWRGGPISEKDPEIMYHTLKGGAFSKDVVLPPAEAYLYGKEMTEMEQYK